MALLDPDYTLAQKPLWEGETHVEAIGETGKVWFWGLFDVCIDKKLAVARPVDSCMDFIELTFEGKQFAKAGWLSSSSIASGCDDEEAHHERPGDQGVMTSLSDTTILRFIEWDRKELPPREWLDWAKAEFRFPPEDDHTDIGWLSLACRAMRVRECSGRSEVEHTGARERIEKAEISLAIVTMAVAFFAFEERRLYDDDSGPVYPRDLLTELTTGCKPVGSLAIV